MIVPTDFNLTPKQRAFCHHYLETNGDGPEAASRAYNCTTRGSARVMAHKALHNPKVQDYLQVLLIEHRAPDRMVQTLDDAFGACRVVNGRLTLDPDWGVRLKAVRLVRDILGLGSRGDTRRGPPSAACYPDELAQEPTQVLRFMLEHQRYPTPDERRLLLAEAAGQFVQ